ncbi:MAG TPA: DUF4286 family protein [Bacteroidia bacterium]|nr:DUF4286 family protein [Bacteroidia bacterium]
MIIYNVTVNIDSSVHDEWLDWMKNTHIPEVVATGCFSAGHIFRIMVDEQSGVSYSIQYTAASIEEIQRYMKDFAPALQKEHTEKYADKFTAFRTLLEKV